MTQDALETRKAASGVTAALGALTAYVFTYLVWINYTATGAWVTGIFGKHEVHAGMSPVLHPSPEILRLFYCPLIWADLWCGRLVVSVG